MAEYLNRDERTDSFWENAWGGKFLCDCAVHLINQKLPGLGIHRDLSREAGHSKGISRKAATAQAIPSYLWATPLVYFIVTSLDLQGLIKNKMGNLYLPGCQNKMNSRVWKGMATGKAFDLCYCCVLGGLIRKGVRRQRGILMKAIALSSDGMVSNPCSVTHR